MVPQVFLNSMSVDDPTIQWASSPHCNLEMIWMHSSARLPDHSRHLSEIKAAR